MRKKFLLVLVFLTMAYVIPVYAGNGSTQGGAAVSSAPDWVLNSAITVSMLFAVVGIFITLSTLVNANLTNITNAPQGEKWNLAQALSEEVDVSDDPNAKKTIFVASSSRLIALVAMIVIVSLLIGITPVIIWSYANSGTMPDLEKLSTFMVACAGAFLPYMANQARAAFSK